MLSVYSNKKFNHDTEVNGKKSAYLKKKILKNTDKCLKD